jgi:CHAT domain-containing protein
MLVAMALAGCSPSENEDVRSARPLSAPVTEEMLRACPADDVLWSRAVDQARRKEADLDRLVVLTTEIGDACAERWEPVWTRAYANYWLGRQRRSRELRERSREGFARARRLAQAAGDPVGVSRSTNMLAWARFVLGEDRNDVELLYGEARVAAREAGRLDLEAMVDNNHTALLMQSGRVAQALETMRSATEGFERSGQSAQFRKVASNRARLLFNIGQLAEARELLERVHANALAEGDDWRVARSSLTRGHIHLLLDERDEARSWFTSIPREYADLALPADLGLARLALRERDCASAAERLDRILAQEELDAAFSLACRAYRAQADLCAGRTGDARRRLSPVIEEADLGAHRDIAFFAGLLYGKSLLETEDHGAAVDYFRAAVERVQAQGEGLDPMDEGIGYLRERAEPFVELAAALAETGADTETLRTVEQAHARALRRAMLEREASAPEIVPLPTLRSSLVGDALLLDFLIGEDRGVVVAITHDEVRVEKLPGWGELRDPLRSYRAALRRPLISAEARLDPEADLRRAIEDAKRLRRLLFGPVEDLLEAATRVYVVPDQDLALLPLAALPLDESGSDRVEGPLRFLGETTEIAMLPMAAVPPTWPGRRAPLLLAGDPLPDTDGEFPPLPLSSEELAAVDAVWSGGASTRLEAEELSAARLRELPLKRFGTLHFATHAVASSLDPRRCAVIFSHGERLGIQEIAALDLGPALVVLSACRTGEGEVIPGEGVVGLSWAFLRAGARGVAASLWSVEDRSTAELMVALHRNLKSGHDPVRALALAQRELAATRTHPAYWAPFVVILGPQGS